MKTLILLVGLPGSGKTTVANFLAKKYRAAVFHSGDIIRAEIRRRGLAYTPENDMKIANWFHTAGRDLIIADKTWKIISRMRAKIIIVEGFRNLKQYNSLCALNKKQNKFSKMILLSVSAPFSIRAKRELGRGRFSKGETLSYLRTRDSTESKHGLKNLIAKTKYKIDTSGNLKETENNTKKLMKKILQI